MLSKLRCPHTGLVNFFTDVDPFMSVGSIIATAPLVTFGAVIFLIIAAV